jgi:hypothetical protein
MKPKLNRREFLAKCSQAGIGVCALMLSPQLMAMNNFTPGNDDEIPDPKKLNYCGYKCPDDCKFLKASIANDPELKKEAYEIWKIKEKYDIDFDAEKIFCFGCKVDDKPIGVTAENCTVRQCAISKNFDCCIECPTLTDCDKGLWTQFPDFKKSVIEMQVKYLESKK